MGLKFRAVAGDKSLLRCVDPKQQSLLLSLNVSVFLRGHSPVVSSVGVQI